MRRMSRWFRGCGLGVALIAVGSIGFGPAHAMTLEEALAKAYLNNPTLNAARAALRATDEGVPQALSGWRPTVELSYDIGREHAYSNTTNINGQSETRTPRSGALTVEQNVFQGGSTNADIRQAENDVLAQRARLSDTEQQVMFDAGTVYMDVLRDEAVLRLNINNERVLQRQLEATRDRFEVGEVTRTDVAQAESRLSRANADRIQAEGDLVSSRARFRNVIGDMPGTLTGAEPLSELPANEDTAVDMARMQNPSVVAAGYDERSAKASVSSIEGELLPSIDVVGTLARNDQTSSRVNRSEEASVIAEVTVPLYQAGSVSSRVRQAKQRWSQRRKELDAAVRDSIRAATAAWKAYETARAQITAFSSGVRAAEIALEGVRQEAQVGSRTVLDVLDAEQELLNSRVGLVRAQRDAVVASFDLRQAVGTLQADNLDLPVEVYNPASHYQRVRGKWFGTGIGGE